jgi:hypothetical protein
MFDTRTYFSSLDEIMSHGLAETRRDIGIDTSEGKANLDKAGWSDEAMHGLELYCQAHEAHEFLAEDVRAWTEEMGVVAAPENGRAWGGVIRRAARQGLIIRVGYGRAKSSNCAPKCLWVAA